MTAEELHVHVHVTVDNGNAELKELLMSTKEEVLAELAAANELATETNKDIARVIAKLDEAIANQDLTAVSEAVATLRATQQAGDDALEAAVPEVVEPPVEPTP